MRPSICCTRVKAFARLFTFELFTAPEHQKMRDRIRHVCSIELYFTGIFVDF
jgi:hypothetical protein